MRRDEARNGRRDAVNGGSDRLVALAKSVGSRLLASGRLALDRGRLRGQLGAEVRELLAGLGHVPAHDRPRRPCRSTCTAEEGDGREDQARALERSQPRQGGAKDADHASVLTLSASHGQKRPITRVRPM